MGRCSTPPQPSPAPAALGQEEEARTCWSKALEAKPELAQGYFEPARN